MLNIYSLKMNKYLTESLIKGILIIFVSIIIIVLLIKRFIYFRPSKKFIITKGVYKPIHHKHLYGWLLDNPNSDKIILLCSGNTGNISYNEDKIMALGNLGYSVLAFDYSGYGKSNGVPTEQQLYDDASHMTAMLHQQYQPQQIILYGTNIGGPIATYVARRYSIPTLILETPIANMKVFIENKFPFLSWISFIFSEFDCSSYLYGFKGRSLLLHAVIDEIIPYESTIHLQKMATLHIPLDGSHNDPILPWEDIKAFIEQY